MLAMSTSIAARFAALALFFSACGSNTVGPDASIANDDAAAVAFADALVVVQPDAATVGMDDAAAMVSADAAAVPGNDAAPGNPDAAAMPLNESLSPGEHIDVAQGRVAIGATYTAVTALLGAGVRTAQPNTRSYDWHLAGGVDLTVWFTNTNLDNDDPPADVDGTDTVLWIAVSGNFTGTTPMNIGIGSTRAQLEAAYMAPPRTTVIDMPAGLLAQYYTRGFLAAYAPDNTVRTFTVTKLYRQEPNGTIDIANLRLDFGGGRTITMSPLQGTSPGDIKTLLGPPDSEGAVPNQNNLDLLNYAFIGIEIVISTALGDHAATAIVHAPFYGTTGAMTASLGSTRAAFEDYALTVLNATGPNASARTMGLFCYTLRGGNNRTFGVTYNAEVPPKVSAIILGQCM